MTPRVSKWVKATKSLMRNMSRRTLRRLRFILMLSRLSILTKGMSGKRLLTQDKRTRLLMRESMLILRKAFLSFMKRRKHYTSKRINRNIANRI